jgi:hypothetical protein
MEYHSFPSSLHQQRISNQTEIEVHVLQIALLAILALALVALGILIAYQHVQANRIRAQKRAELSLLMNQARERENAGDAAQAFDLFRSACRLANEAEAFDIGREALHGAGRNAHAASDPIVGRRFRVVAGEVSRLTR